jgi:hypothetical protein
MGKNKNIIFKIRKKTRMSILITFIQYSDGNFSQRIRQEKEKKSHTNREEESQVITVCRLYVLYPEKPKGSIKRLLKMINALGKVTVDQSNIYKSMTTISKVTFSVFSNKTLNKFPLEICGCVVSF